MMDSIQHFWIQFKKMNMELYLMQDLPMDIKVKKVSILSQALAEYHKDLDFLIRNSTPKAELTISASGNPYLFKDVELLVNFAPTLERWKISAFIQPENDLQVYKDAQDQPFMYEGVSIKVSDSYFKVFDNKSKSRPLGIQVLLKNYVVFKDHPKLYEAMDTQIEHLLGEKVFANQLAFIDIAQLTPKNRVNALPLYQLYEHFLKYEEK